MARTVRTPRSAWIEEGFRALAAGGPDAVRVEVLAETLGVTKGGFYGHFADRRTFLEEVLDTWERASTDEVLKRVEREGADPGRKMRRAAALTLSASRLLPVDLAVRDWSRHDDAVAERVRRVDNRRMDYLRQQFTAILGDDGRDPDTVAIDVEARCLVAFSLAIGTHFTAADHGSLSRAEVIEHAVRLLEGRA